jgi:cytochrome c oxidase cbb3-type subunit 1
MALHLNWQLYGWCSLPMVGALFVRFLRPTESALSQGRWVFRLWSFALILGGLSWLAGDTSGKLFLDWKAVPRLVFVFALVFLWVVLAWNYSVSVMGHALRIRSILSGETMVLLILAAVPGILFWASGRRVYPAVDPGTGGPTGASLLGSTLVIVLVMALLPRALRLARTNSLSERPFWILFCADSAIFLAIEHGSSRHEDWRQIAGLGSLLVWVPVMVIHLRRYVWHRGSRLWLNATFVWWALLVVSGFVSFLPGILDRFKFTHALVAHAHLAMGGLLTSLNMLVLANLASPATVATEVLSDGHAFFIWQGGLILHLIALFLIGAAEIESPGDFFAGGVVGWYWLRLLAGAIMAAISVRWAWRVWVTPRPGSETVVL